MRKVYCYVGLIGVLLFYSVQVYAETIVLEPTAKNKIINGWGLNNNHYVISGTSQPGAAYNDGTQTQRTFLKFDLDSFESADDIVTATLSIHHPTDVYAGQAEGTHSLALLVTTPWDKPNWAGAVTDGSNTPAGVLAPWTNAGGDFIYDYGSPPNTDYVANDEDAWLSYNVTDMTKAWVAGTYANNGLMLAASVGNLLHFSGDGITLTVTTVPEPSTIVIMLTGALGLVCYAWRRYGR